MLTKPSRYTDKTLKFVLILGGPPLDTFMLFSIHNQSGGPFSVCKGIKLVWGDPIRLIGFLR